MKESRAAKPHKRLIQDTTSKLRELILSRAPDAQIGSLNEVAQMLGVGIVTVQQAARILEHEGLLAVRRGPGGGYYGRRPDEAALQRSLAAYMRVHGLGYHEALEMIALLDCEIVPAAARCRDEVLRRAMSGLIAGIDDCDTVQSRATLETRLRTLLHQMASHPLAEFLLGVTASFYHAEPASDTQDPVFTDAAAVAIWKTGKRRMMQSIADGDEERAHFEAERYRRQVLRLLRGG